MVAVAWPIAGLRRLSRRALAGLFAGGSVLASRPVADLLASVSDLSDLGFGLFTIYQALGGGNALAGFILTYLFFGYLVYAYTPDLYLGEFGDIVEARGFRALTALTALYFGLLFGRITGSVPDESLFVHLPQDEGGLMTASLAGLAVIIIAFTGYIHLIRGERLFDRSSDTFETIDTLGHSSAQEELERVETLPRRRRYLVVAINESLVGMLYVTPAALLGLTLPVVDVLSPIPEGLVVVAVLGRYASIDGRLPGSLPDDTSTDIEFRIADNVTDSLQNGKGTVLVGVCILGVALSATILVFGIDALIESGGVSLETWPGITAIPGVLEGQSLSELGVLTTRLWGGIGIVTSLITYGIYSLLYWFQQLQRLPAYVPFWRDYWQGESSSPPVSSVTRPPGLLLPGNAILLALFALTWLTNFVDSMIWWVGFGVVWPVLVGLIVWSVRAGYRRPPQPLRGDGRAVLIAFVLQITVFGVGAVVLTQQSPWFLLGILVLLVGSIYSPEVMVYSQRQEGVAHYFDLLYSTGLFGVLLLILESRASIPLVVYLIIAGILLVWLLLRIVGPSPAGTSMGE